MVEMAMKCLFFLCPITDLFLLSKVKTIFVSLKYSIDLKKISACFILFLLTVFLFENIGIYGYLMFNRQNARHLCMVNQAKKKSLERIAIPLNEVKKNLIRLKKDEVLWQGKLYDILAEKYINDCLILIAYQDEHEENLLTALRDYFNDFAKNPFQTGKKIMPPVFLKDIKLTKPDNIIITSMGDYVVCYNIYQQKALTDYFFSIPNPPPECC